MSYVTNEKIIALGKELLEECQRVDADLGDDAEHTTSIMTAYVANMCEFVDVDEKEEIPWSDDVVSIHSFKHWWLHKQIFGA